MLAEGQDTRVAVRLRWWCATGLVTPFVAFLLTLLWYCLAVHQDAESLAHLDPHWWPAWADGWSALDAGLVPAWLGMAGGLIVAVFGGWVCERPAPVILAGLWAFFGSLLIQLWYVFVTFWPAVTKPWSMTAGKGRSTMNFLVNVAFALGSVLGAYLLLFVGVWAMMARRFGAGYMADIGAARHASPVAAALLYLVLPGAVVLGALLYLPPAGRLRAAAGGGLVLASLLAAFQ